MFKQLSVGCALLLAAVACYAADFRSVSWGMSQKQVQNLEKASLLKQDDAQMLFETTIGQQPVRVLYRFEAGKLASARYEFTKQYRQSEVYIQVYDALQSQLETKYGRAASAVTRCDDAFYKEYPSRWGTGLVVGKLTRESIWKNDSTKVRHVMGALPGGSVGHWVEYSPANDKPKADEAVAFDAAL